MGPAEVRRWVGVSTDGRVNAPARRSPAPPLDRPCPPPDRRPVTTRTGRTRRRPARWPAGRRPVARTKLRRTGGRTTGFGWSGCRSARRCPRRWEALDGLRGLATTIMIAYHLGVPWLPGGVITMDMFFMLSGFLITGLLVAEYDRRGRISLSVFYSRRARRLSAMLVALTATMLLWRLTAEPSQLPGLQAMRSRPSGTSRTGTSPSTARATSTSSRPRRGCCIRGRAVEEQFYLPGRSS